jgi:hypothetical protein
VINPFLSLDRFSARNSFLGSEGVLDSFFRLLAEVGDRAGEVGKDSGFPPPLPVPAESFRFGGEPGRV